MIFKLMENGWYAELRLSDNVAIPIKLVTGASVSVLSYDVARKYACDECEFEKLFTEHKKIRVAASVFGGIEIVPCVAHGASIDTTYFPDFYFGVCKNFNHTMAGCDFFAACDLSKEVGGDFVISNFDFDSYKQKALNLFCSEVVDLTAIGN